MTFTELGGVSTIAKTLVESSRTSIFNCVFSDSLRDLAHTFEISRTSFGMIEDLRALDSLLWMLPQRGWQIVCPADHE